MKKFVLLVAVCLAAIPAFAQLNVKASVKSKTIATFRMGVISVDFGSSGYKLVLVTDNQFDKPGIFYLGQDQESATKTVDDMIAILEEADTDAAVSAECGPGQECMLTVRKQLGVPVLWYKFQGCAGRQGLSMDELKKVRAAINK